MNLFVCEGLEETSLPFPTPEHERLKGMMIALLRFIREGGDETKVSEVTGKIVDLFIKHFDIFFFHSGEKFGEKGGEMLMRLHEINDYLHKHIKEKITVGDIAAQLNFTEGYMSEYMRKASVGFRGMLSYIRANASESLLLNTDKTILEISEECGFSDVKYYYSAFKRWYNCTPKQFRDQYGRASEEKLRYFELDDISDLIDDLMKQHYMQMYLG